MLIWIKKIYEMYPYISKKDIKLVLETNNVKCYEENAEFNWHQTTIKLYNEIEIKKVFSN